MQVENYLSLIHSLQLKKMCFFSVGKVVLSRFCIWYTDNTSSRVWFCGCCVQVCSCVILLHFSYHYVNTIYYFVDFHFLIPMLKNRLLKRKGKWSGKQSQMLVLNLSLSKRCYFRCSREKAYTQSGWIEKKSSPLFCMHCEKYIFLRILTDSKFIYTGKEWDTRTCLQFTS